MLKVALSVVVAGLILRGAGLSMDGVLQVDFTTLQLVPAFAFLSVVILLGAFVLQAWLWSGIVMDLGDRRPPILTATGIVLVANLGRYIPGKVLQVAGQAVLARRAGFSGTRAVVAGATGQLLSLLAAVAVGGWVAYGAFPGNLGLVTIVGILVLVGCALYFGWAGALLNWGMRRSGHDGAQVSGLSRRRLAYWLGGYLGGWLVYGSAFYCLVRGLGFDLPLTVAATSFAGAYLVGYLVIFAPAGIGVRESTLVFFLAPLLGQEASIIVSVLQRAWITAVELAAVACSLFIVQRTAEQ